MVKFQPTSKLVLIIQIIHLMDLSFPSTIYSQFNHVAVHFYYDKIAFDKILMIISTYQRQIRCNSGVLFLIFILENLI